MVQYPTIRRGNLTSEEVERALEVESNLYTLAHLAEEFEHSHLLSLNAAINLIEGRDSGDSRRLETMKAWEKIAARNGAMVAYGFQEVIQSLNANIGKCPRIRKLLDKAIRRDADKTFKTHFPQITKTRLAAAHPGEFHSTRSGQHKHSLKGGSISMNGIHVNVDIEGGSFFASDILSRNDQTLIFAATVLGVFVSYELSPTTVAGIKRAVNLYWLSLQATGSDGRSPFPKQ